jgi:hypothetical protein
VLNGRVESLRKRVDFLRSIGLSAGEAASVIGRCPSVLILSVENNLWPKVEYLTQHMRGSPDRLVSCPVYLTLSLNNRWALMRQILWPRWV